MADVQILRATSGPIPGVYTLPDNAEFRLKAVQASFDGSGAGGTFLPCVTLLSNSGDVIARACDQDVQVAAGDNAEVSWFPGVKHAGAGAADAGDPWPQHQYIDLAATLTFGIATPAAAITADATMFTNHYLGLNSSSGEVVIYFKMGPRYARHEVVLTGNKGPDFAIQHYEIAWIGPDLQANQGARNPVALLEDVHDVVEPVTWIDVAGDVDRYQAGAAVNITWGLNWRVTGAVGTRATAVGTDADGYKTVNGGPGVYALRITTPTKNALSTDFKAQWSEITVNRIDSGGLL